MPVRTCDCFSKSHMILLTLLFDSTSDLWSRHLHRAPSVVHDTCLSHYNIYASFRITVAQNASPKPTNNSSAHPSHTNSSCRRHLICLPKTTQINLFTNPFQTLPTAPHRLPNTLSQTITGILTSGSLPRPLPSLLIL